MGPSDVDRILRALQDVGVLLDRLDRSIGEAVLVRQEVARVVSRVGFLVDDALQEALKPTCPKCGRADMKLRTNGDNGVRFWGCAGYPTCKGGLDYAKWVKAAQAAFKASSSAEGHEEGDSAVMASPSQKSRRRLPGRPKP